MSPRLTDEQLAERAQGLGASDVATAAGVNPWQTPLELYLTKIGELDPDAAIDDASRGRMERGHRLENVALEWDRDETGEAFYRVRQTIWHPRLPFLFCHPDATRDPFGKLTHLIEVKTSSRRWNEVPRHVEVQCQMQMACTGATVVTILLLTFDGKPIRFTVERDDELIAALEQMASAFWDRIQRRDPPPMDGSAGASTWLDRTRWRNEPDLIADETQRLIMAEVVRLKHQLDVDQALYDTAVNELKFTMAGSGRLNAPGIGRVIWTAPTTTRTTKWKEVAAELSPSQELIDKYTSERESRSFIVRPDERED